MNESKRPQRRELDRVPQAGQAEDHPGGVAGGAFAGGTTGGLARAAVAGSALAERVDPAHEDDYWRHEFPKRPYAVSSPHGYEDFSPAYRLGYERYSDCLGRRFDEVEPEFARHWEDSRGQSRLRWDEARPATRDAYERIGAILERAVPGDADRGSR